MKRWAIYTVCLLFVGASIGCTKKDVQEKQPVVAEEAANQEITGTQTQGTSTIIEGKIPEKKPEEIAVIDTKFGQIKIKFFENDAPKHVQNFKNLAKQGFYNNTTFHRVIPGFMIQGGDPNTKDADRSNDGLGGPGFNIHAEFNSHSHQRGIVSMARSADPNSAGSQFFICVAPATFLDRQYTVFGEVISGMDVADKIVNVPRDPQDNPLERIDMTVTVTGK
ncbi:peptidylprolyl isomerase [Candidatus Desantisbacteria bacterium]|nr:peptidylprolyl isomerase [Candidatus Desantisbacteria bacterium]